MVLDAFGNPVSSEIAAALDDFTGCDCCEGEHQVDAPPLYIRCSVCFYERPAGQGCGLPCV